MAYLLLYFIGPAVVVFLIQSLLCRRAKRRAARHGLLVFPTVCAAVGIVTLFTQCGDIFGGLGAVAALLWLFGAGCMALGYAAAWAVYFITKKGENRA